MSQFLYGDMVINGNLTVLGTLRFRDDLRRQFPVPNIRIDGNMTIEGDITVVGNLEIKGTLTTFQTESGAPE